MAEDIFVFVHTIAAAAAASATAAQLLLPKLLPLLVAMLLVSSCAYTSFASQPSLD